MRMDAPNPVIASRPAATRTRNSQAPPEAAARRTDPNPAGTAKAEIRADGSKTGTPGSPLPTNFRRDGASCDQFEDRS